MNDIGPFFSPDDLTPEPQNRTSKNEGGDNINQDNVRYPVEQVPNNVLEWLYFHWKSVLISVVILSYVLVFTSVRKNFELIFSLSSKKHITKKINKIKEIRLYPKTSNPKAGLFSFGPSVEVTGDYQEELERALLKAVSVKGKVKRGERVIRALVRNGLNKRESERLVASFESKGIFHFRKAQPGNTFVVRMSPEGDKAYYFEYHYGRRITLVAVRKKYGFDVKKIIKPITTKLLGVVLVLTKGGLSKSVVEAEQSPSLAAKISVLIEDEIPLNRLSSGDRFELLVERTYVGKNPDKYGRILALNISTKLKGDYEIFYYRQPELGGGYYTADGLGFFRVFLNRPVNGDAPFDRDPFHGDGVIFPSGKGALVYSVGRGIVKWVGWKKTRGKMVIIQHPSGYQTAYYYLWKTSHIKVGDSVEKRTILGKAGAPIMNPVLTGVGFSGKKNGRYITPQELYRIRESSIEPKNFKDFQLRVVFCRNLLKLLSKMSVSSYQLFKNVKLNGSVWVIKNKK